MHVGMRISPTTSICMALLLTGVPVAMVILGADGALSQHGTGTLVQAPLFTVVNLHPRGFIKSLALGVSNGQQVGIGVVTGDHNHALLWRGSAESVVDLTPSGLQAEVHGACGGQQVGYGYGSAIPTGTPHALLWRGSAAGMVDLNPNGFEGSDALSISGGQQVGGGSGPATGGQDHALVWRGTPASVVDLHPPGFTNSHALATSGKEQVGYGSGPDTGGSNHALLWRGSAASVMDLNPRGFSYSEAHGTAGRQQVGYGSGPGTGAFPVPGTPFHDHALLWHGSPASVVDLNPPGFIISYAYATNGEEQVGTGSGPATHGEGHALLWHGSAASVVDLHTFLPPGFVRSAALAIDAAGDVVGSASTVIGPAGDDYAILWKRNVPKPGTSPEQNATGC